MKQATYLKSLDSRRTVTPGTSSWDGRSGWRASCSKRLGVLVVLATALAGCGADAGARGGSVTERAAGQASSAIEHIDDWSDGALDLYFVPGGLAAEERIAAEIAAATSSIRVAMYNMRSSRLGYLLLAKQQQGLSVEVMWDAKQMAQSYNTLDDELGAAGLNIVPVLNDGHEYATLHHKFAVMDDELVLMGSANWNDSAMHDNNEVVIALRSPTIASVVDAELDEILSGTKLPRSGDVSSPLQLYFAPEDDVDHVLEQAIDEADERIVVAMFSLRLGWLATALTRAHARGVNVSVITDLKQSSTTTTDEILKDAGIEVIEALNDTTPYTAMHHKFMVVDGAHTFVGSYNWTYTATVWSYEDLAVIRDHGEVAAAFEGEFGRLWQRYAPERPNPVGTTLPARVSALCDDTSWGDTLHLVGNLVSLGAWNPHEGIALSGDGWPIWTGTADIRVGAAFEYKLVIVRSDGAVRWESGPNRRAVMPTDTEEPGLELNDAFRY